MGSARAGGSREGVPRASGARQAERGLPSPSASWPGRFQMKGPLVTGARGTLQRPSWVSLLLPLPGLSRPPLTHHWGLRSIWVLAFCPVLLSDPQLGLRRHPSPRKGPWSRAAPAWLPGSRGATLLSLTSGSPFMPHRPCPPPGHSTLHSLGHHLSRPSVPQTPQVQLGDPGGQGTEGPRLGGVCQAGDACFFCSILLGSGDTGPGPGPVPRSPTGGGGWTSPFLGGPQGWGQRLKIALRCGELLEAPCPPFREHCVKCQGRQVSELRSPQTPG